MTSRPHRIAISLLEVLVAILVIAILLGLLLSAVQKVRVAAVRMKSANTLRQVIIATHHFATAHSDRLPNTFGQPPNRGGDSVFAALTPFLEIPVTKAVDGKHVAFIPLFISPSDPSVQALPSNRGNISYAANAQVFTPGAALPRSFPDGLSTTIAFAEHYARCGKKTGFSWSLMSAVCVDGTTGRVVPCANPRHHKATFADPVYDDILPGSPLAATQAFQAAPAPLGCDPRLPQTPYASGMLVAVADGGVRTIANSVAPDVFWASVTPAGGEVVPSPW